MNKNVIDNSISIAYEAINKAGISNNGRINKSYRGQISTFGAAIVMGSLESAICYFSEKAINDSGVDRSKLLEAIKYVLRESRDTKEKYVFLVDLKDYSGIDKKKLFPDSFKEDTINAAIAIKLAMNLFEWEGNM